MSDFSHEEQAKRLYGLDEMEAEALEVLRLIVRQTARERISTPTWLRERRRSSSAMTTP